MIKLASPEIDECEITLIEKVLLSGNLVQGKYVTEFEGKIANYLEVESALAVSSGTAALHLALIALGIGTGDEVIVPSFSFPATTNVVELVGATCKFVDIQLNSFCMNAEKILSELTEKTKAIIIVHEFGQPADMNEIMRIAQENGLVVIEDAACALGAKVGERYVGTIGDVGCFSLHPRKAITCGEGGLIVTRSTAIVDRLRSLRNHGMVNTDQRVDFVEPGFNYRMTDIQAAMAVAQFDKLEGIISRRLELASVYNSQLKTLKGIVIPEQSEGQRHVYQSYHVMTQDRAQRDALKEYLKERGVETNYGAYCIPMLTYYKGKYAVDSSQYSNAQYAHDAGLALPLHTKLDEETVIDICRYIHAWGSGE